MFLFNLEEIPGVFSFGFRWEEHFYELSNISIKIGYGSSYNVINFTKDIKKAMEFLVHTESGGDFSFDNMVKFKTSENDIINAILIKFFEKIKDPNVFDFDQCLVSFFTLFDKYLLDKEYFLSQIDINYLLHNNLIDKSDVDDIASKCSGFDHIDLCSVLPGIDSDKIDQFIDKIGFYIDDDVVDVLDESGVLPRLANSVYFTPYIINIYARYPEEIDLFLKAAKKIRPELKEKLEQINIMHKACL